jgi:hypothetical protein
MQHTCNPEKPNDKHQLYSTHRIVRQVRIAVITIISANKKTNPNQKKKEKQKTPFSENPKMSKRKRKRAEMKP